MINTKFKFIGLNILCLFFVFNIALAESLDISFVDKLRYSQDSFFAGENIRVYTTLQNNSGFDLRGTIRFYDNQKFIGDFDFFVANQKSIEAWTDWQSEEGERNLSVKINDLKKLEINKEPENISLDKEILILEKKFVDIDTDKDGKGNIEDEDDDNDGILDKAEIEQGTNPQIFNKPVLKIEDSNKENDNETELKLTTDSSTNENIIVSGDLIESAKNITEVTLEKSKDLTGTTKNFLEKQKEAIDEEIEKDKKIELAQKELLEFSGEEVKEEDNFYTANIIDAVPSMKEMYSLVLGILIFIFDTWWVLLAVIGLIFWLLYKYLRNKMSLRRF